MRPAPLGEGLGDLFGHPLGVAAGEELPYRRPHLPDRLLRGVGQDQRAVVDPLDGLLPHDLQHRRGGELPQLGVHRPQHRVFAHHDLVGGQSDQSPAGHGVVGDERGHLSRMALDRPGDLQGRQHQPTGGVEHDVAGHLRVGQVDGPDHLLGVVDVDVAEKGKPQKAHGLLPVHEEDHPRAPQLLDLGDQPLTGVLQHPLLEHRLERRQHKEDPEKVEDGHLSPPLSASGPTWVGATGWITTSRRSRS